MTNLVAFYVGKINCNLMIHIVVGLKVRIVDMGTINPLDYILESLLMLFQVPIL